MAEHRTITDWSTALAQKKVSALEAVDYFLTRIKKIDPELNSYLAVEPELARSAALAIDERRARGEVLSDLAGIPFGVKDSLNVKGFRSAAAAKILDNYVSPYNTTIIKKIREAGAIPLGKHNCDAFGHGSSTENSMYGPVKNPWDLTRVPGGSSGGSSAALAADLCAFSIAEDTGGSVRYPASFCGLSGLRVSYGRNSRFGAMPMASSFDTIGPLAKNVADLALLLENMAGVDPLDPTTATAPVPKYTTEIKKSIKGLKIGVPKEYFSADLDSRIAEKIQVAIKELEKAGAHVKEISLPHTEYALAAYYIIVPCEISSNFARLDGMRYGVRGAGADLYASYTAARGVGFPAEVKRRIMIGTFALSHGYYDAYYLQAQKVRTLVKNDFTEAFKEVDVIAAPTASEVAFKLGEKTNDPMKMYLADIFMIPAPLAGIPALSVPCGFVDNLPVGLQLIGPYLREEIPLQFGYQYQQLTGWHNEHPNI